MNVALKDNLKTCLEFFRAESCSCSNREIVGFLGLRDGKPVAKIVKNRAPDPQNYFAVDPLEMLEFQTANEFLAIFHSHIYGDSQFSDWDTKTSDNCLIPFVVYSLSENKFNIYIPENSIAAKENIVVLEEIVND